MNKKDRKILDEALKRFHESHAMEYDNRNDAIRCSEFVDGKQWDPKAINDRKGRPVITINKLRKFVLQISGELQQNRPELIVSPLKGGATIEGAQLRNDIIRHIEYMSNADVAYDTAVQQALEGGYGFWRIITQYSKDSFDQDIVIKRVPNRFSVILDQFAQSPTYEDGMYAFVIDEISRSRFEALYPGVSIPSGPSLLNPYGVYNWYTPESVTIAEYFWKEPYREEIWLLENGEVINSEQIKSLKESELGEESLESPVISKRSQTKYRIKWMKFTFDEILEGPQDFPGEYIPIIFMSGYEFNDQGKRRFRGIVYDALDAVRMYNYWKVAIAEILGSAPKTNRFVTPEQTNGFENEWNTMNIIPRPYTHYNFIPGVPPPMQEPPMPIPTGAANEAAASAMDIQDTIGLYGANLGQPSNERTGRAIRLRQERGDATVFTFVNNYQNALLYTGKILLSMIPEVYSAKRIMKIMTKDGGIKDIILNNPSVDLRKLEGTIENDLNDGEYDMIPTIGPNYATKRKEVVASMLDFLQFFPAAGPLLAPKIAKLMDWEGAQSIAAELQNIINQQSGEGQPVGHGQQQPGAAVQNSSDINSAF